jgi:hypothetical protein
MALAEPVMTKKTQKVSSEGDAVFVKILKISKLSKEISTKYSAEYYKLAFRDTKVFHFEEGAFIK